jgi:hypothetical protein
LSRDPRSYAKVIDIHFEEKSFAICKTCCSSYPINENGEIETLVCISKVEKDSKICGEKLYMLSRGIRRPVQVFRYRRFDDWLQEFIGRPGNLNVLDSSWSNSKGDSHDPSTDFWGGSYIRGMKGPNQISLVSSVPENETRLLFSLAIDWFNPFHNKAAGKHASSGVIFLRCLNLPPEERNKPENIYLVGIMPGRRQASNLDGIIEPLVQDLLRYWENGVYFIGIPSINQPRLIRCALAQLICDLPAARKVAGFPGHGAKYNCSVCMGSRDEMADLSLLENPATERTSEDHLRYARLYKNVLGSSGRKEAEKFRKNHDRAVRWSPLNELPYWDPINCTVIDAMHLTFLGLCQLHWRRFWNADGVFKYDNSQSQTLSCEVGADSISLDQMERDEWIDEEFPQRHEDASLFCTHLGDIVDGSKKVLTVKSSRKARQSWIYGNNEALLRLSIPQILALLKENGGKIPQSYMRKQHLVDLLIVGRGLNLGICY